MELSTVEKLELELCEKSDITFAKLMGLSAIDLFGLREYCREEQRLLILRSGNPASRKHMFNPNMRPKVVTEKGKTNDDGYVKTRSGKFFADYDMMSLWQFDGRLHKKIWTNNNPDLLHQLNMCCASRGMFMHGANDDFYNDLGVFLGDGFVDWGKPFVVFDRFGKSYSRKGKEELRRFYNYHRMCSDESVKVNPKLSITPKVWPYS
jgi:hypothetical protein